ncbi:MAG: hypothetical protein ACWGHP_10890 [Stenotrophomonas sp.]
MTSARHFISQEGQLQRTTSSTDLAVDGQGFFVMTEKAENVGATDSRLFTRAGAFTIDNLGYLKNSVRPVSAGLAGRFQRRRSPPTRRT